MWLPHFADGVVEGLEARNLAGSEVVGEAGPGLAFRTAPLDFGQGEHTGEEHIFKVLVAGDELRPEIALHSENVVAVLGADAFKRLVGVAFLNREVVPDAVGSRMGSGPGQ